MIKVVVTEDEWILRKGLIASIDWAALGCTVVGEAGNGVEGLALIRRENPDIVITDIRMPMMDGLEMLRQARETNTFSSVILTGYSEFEYAKKAISLQVTEYLLKPVDEDALYALLQKMVGALRRDRKEEDPVQLSQFKKLSILLREEQGVSQNFYVSKTLDIIHTQYHQKLSVDTIAQELDISTSYLSRKFKEATAHSFVEYLNQYRVCKAAQMLRSGKYRVAEVAEQIGFASYKHFYNVFRDYMDMTPTEFIGEKGSAPSQENRK